MPASVVNNSPHPTAVALGRPDNPIAPSNRPATNAINLGQRGMPGMPAENSGTGPRATQVTLGSGSPGSQATSGYNGVRAVQGIPHGVPGGTGPNTATGRTPGQVNLGQSVQPAPTHASLPTTNAQSAPKVLFKPTPVYTAEATALHLSGEVAVRIRVSATGSSPFSASPRRSAMGSINPPSAPFRALASRPRSTPPAARWTGRAWFELISNSPDKYLYRTGWMH